MKIFQFLAMLTISVLLFTGCETDEITNYAFQDISAPTNVQAKFDVAQDDSGDVSITPSGEGAQTFQVYFGDGDETPLEVAPGETVSYTYGEGEYLVKVIAIGSTGLTSEFNQRLLISFKAPENLMVNIDQSATNPAKISVSASADFAASFDVYFGDVEDEEPTQLMPDGSIDHTYAAPGTYTVRVVAKGAGVATAETTVEVVVPEANDPVKLPITYDVPTVNYALGTFEGATFEVVTNPFLSGANTEESMVGKLTNNGAQYEGGTYELGEPVDFSGDNKTISLKFYSDKPVSVLVKFEEGVDGARQTEVSAAHGGTGWEILTFNFDTDAVKSYVEGDDAENGKAFVPTGKYNNLVLFAEIGKTTKGTFYIDDIAQEEITGDPLKLPVTFDDNVNYVAATSGTEFAVVSNPKKSGINNSETKVGAVTNAGQQYEALTVNLDEAIDFSGSNKTITMKVYSETAYPVLFKLETGVNGERANEVEVNHGGTGWELLTFNFATNARKSYVGGDEAENGKPFVPSGQYADFSIFLDFAGTTAGTFYLDDIKQAAGAGDGGGTTADTKTSFPVNFETTNNGGAAANWSVFENGDNPGLEIIANPDPSGVNTSSTVAKFTARQAGQPYAGTITQLKSPITLSTSNSKVKIMVWKSVISNVGIKFENAAGGSTGEIKVANTKTNQWEELTFDFSEVVGNVNNTNITGLVIFPDFNERSGETVSYFDNITLNAATSGSGGGGTTSGGDFGLPVSFDGNATYTTSEASVPFKVVTNPKQSGINQTATKVGEVTNAGGAYEALSFILDNAIDFSGSNKTITMKVYSEVAYPVLLKLETGVNGERANQVQVNHGGTGWEVLTFNFAANAKTSYISDSDPGGAAIVPSGKYDEISIFLDFAGTTAGKFYIDDIEQK